jgi:hypothetical protein
MATATTGIAITTSATNGMPSGQLAARFWNATSPDDHVYFRGAARHSADGAADSARARSTRHDGADIAILINRQRLYEHARQCTPQRWSGKIRNWTPVDVVVLNPIQTNDCFNVVS